MAKNIFNSIKVRKPQSSTFDMSHDVKLSLDMGDLVPVACMEVIPGDVWNIQTETLIRFAPLVAPVMHKMNVHTHWFFVPNRIVWPNWEKFITANNGASEVPSPPYLRGSEQLIAQQGSIADYLGLPTDVDMASDKISAIPFAGFTMIYDEYYRDQNLQTLFRDIWNQSATGTDSYLVDGENEIINGYFQKGSLKRSWQHDYFTASLPFAQKGEAVEIPIGSFGDVDVYYENPDFGVTGAGRFRNSLDDSVITDANIETQAGGLVVGDDGTQHSAYYDPNGSLKASTSDLEVGSATINDLRRAFRLQEWLEKMARGGSRYIEQILVHFGVKSSDARLQRPEFLGGSKNPVIISEVLQTSEQIESTPLATMAGHGISAGRGKQIRYRAEEHGYIFGIMSVTPLTAYQQGLHKHWSRRSYLDYAWPSFAHIGEQEVKNKEIYFDPTDNANEDTFGYVPRYSEYRYMDSRVAGDFRENLSFWHLGRIFEDRPHLNSEFIECVPDKRIFAVQDEETQSLWSHVFHSIRVNRRLPKYGTPTL